MCKKHQGSSVPTSNLAELPQHQVADVPPFVNTGVDFTRPFYQLPLKHGEISRR